MYCCQLRFAVDFVCTTVLVFLFYKHVCVITEVEFHYTVPVACFVIVFVLDYVNIMFNILYSIISTLILKL